MFVLLGPPEMAPPSEWSEARVLINDGTYPSSAIVDILSAVLLLAWVACLWFLVSSLLKRRKASDAEHEEADPVDTDDTEPDEPWYRHQAAPLFDEQFSDDFPRVVVPDDVTPGDETPDGETPHSVWGPDPITGDDSFALGGLPQGAMPGHPDSIVSENASLDDAMFEDSVSDAEIIDEAAGPSSEEPPMIVPVRAYYLTRTEDTLRSVSAQFLQTPRRWQELRSLNTASPGVAAAGPDTPLQVGTALALPGDPVPWGKPDPVYLWTLAEKFLFAAWGREPMPEEVAPFWRGLTRGSQLEAGPSVTPEHLAPPEFVTEARPEPDTAPQPEPEPTPPQPEPAAFQPPPQPEPEPEPTPPQPEPAAFQPPPQPEPEPEPTPPQPEPAAFQPPPQPEPTPPQPPPAAFQPPPQPEPTPPQPPPAPAAFQPPPQPEPAAFQPPHQPEPTPPQPEPAPAAFQPPPQPEPAPPPYQSPVPPTHEPPHQSPPHQSPVPPTHEPTPPPYQSPVPPTHEPPYQSPVPPTHEPTPPLARGHVDLGPIEPTVAYVEAEAPRMPSFMPSLTGAEPATAPPESEMVASAPRSLAGTAIGDAMMLWSLSRLRRRRSGSGPDIVDPLEESLRRSARVDSLNLIEAAMRHLRAVTVGRLREKPAVLAVRVGSYGFEVLLNRPTQAPDGWRTASAGYVLELPQGVTVENLDAIGREQPSLCPALVPVGDTLEGPLLLNIEEIGCLIVSGPGTPSVNLLNAIVGTLGTSPLAGDIRIITVGLDSPAGLVGWEKVHSTTFDSPELEELLSAAPTASGAFLDILVVGPGNDVLIQRAGQAADASGARLALVGATSSVTARWPWRIHVDETTTAVVHPIACTMAAAQAMAPAMSQLLSDTLDTPLFAPPRF